jgi:hypothetical protein
MTEKVLLRMCRNKRNLAMKKIIIAAVAMLAVSPAFAGHVNGYVNSHGTYVAAYERSTADGTVTNNYSFQGNVNPYTGSVGHNDYTHSPSSPFFTGY